MSSSSSRSASAESMDILITVLDRYIRNGHESKSMDDHSLAEEAKRKLRMSAKTGSGLGYARPPLAG